MTILLSKSCFDTFLKKIGLLLLFTVTSVHTDKHRLWVKKERVLTNTKSVSFVYERKEESERERRNLDIEKVFKSREIF